MIELLVLGKLPLHLYPCDDSYPSIPLIPGTGLPPAFFCLLVL